MPFLKPTSFGPQEGEGDEYSTETLHDVLASILKVLGMRKQGAEGPPQAAREESWTSKKSSVSS